jgi:hypothetical protein
MIKAGSRIKVYRALDRQELVPTAIMATTIDDNPS